MTGTGASPQELPGTTGTPKGARRSLARRLCNFLDAQKDRINTVQSLITVLAVCVGAFWTYRLFIEQRQNYPRLKIEHQVSHWKISKDQVLLSVDEVLTNTGPVMVELRGGTIRIIQVVPLPAALQTKLPAVKNLPGGSEAENSVYDPKTWEVLVESPRTWKEDTMVIEPGESDIVPNEFVIPASVKVIAVYSYINNPAQTKHRLGWNGLSYYDLDKSEVSTSRK